MIIYFFGAIIVIALVVVFLWAAGKESKAVNPEQIEKKRENLEKVIQLTREKGEISNNDVQFALKVSDATATRYLEELEKQGKLVQTGSGKGTIYRVK